LKKSLPYWDGTTTATVLAHAIVREGAKLVAAGMNPMDLKRGVCALGQFPLILHRILRRRDSLRIPWA
jgi:hypothetical protein